MLQETIAGVVVVESSSDVRHDGLTLLMEGSVSLQFSSKNVGILDAFSSNLKVNQSNSASVVIQLLTLLLLMKSV